MNTSFFFHTWSLFRSGWTFLKSLFNWKPNRSSSTWWQINQFIMPFCFGHENTIAIHLCLWGWLGGRSNSESSTWRWFVSIQWLFFLPKKWLTRWHVTRFMILGEFLKFSLDVFCWKCTEKGKVLFDESLKFHNWKRGGWYTSKQWLGIGFLKHQQYAVITSCTKIFDTPWFIPFRKLTCPTLKRKIIDWKVPFLVEDMFEGNLNSKLPTIWRVEKQMKSR